MRLSFILLVIMGSTALAQDTVTISGKILHPVSDSVMVNYNDNPIAYYPKEFFARLDDQGNFSLAFPVPKNVYTQVNLVHGRKGAELILQQGDKLQLTADAARFDSTVHYEGTGSTVANFIARHYLEKGPMNRYSIKVKTAINKAPADFLPEIAHEMKDETDFLARHAAGLPVSFVSYWTAFYKYYNYFFMQQYPQVHEMIKHRKYTDTIPEMNYMVLKEMPLAFNDSFIQLPPYLLYLTGVFDIKLKAEGFGVNEGEKGKRKREDSVVSMVYKLMPNKSAEYFIAQDIYGRAKSREPKVNEKELAVFKKKWPQSTYYSMLLQQVALAKRLSKGQPAPDIDITGADGKKMKLSDLRGKVVYLGFWASWCRQCVVEMVNENKMKLLLTKKPVVFVYVSIDNDTAAAREMVEKYKVEGSFAYVAGGWSAKELQAYGVQSLPDYFLIDQQGNFAKQNAPTPPQTTELLLEIGKLLK